MSFILYCAIQSVCLFYRPNQVAEKVAARIAENFGEAAIVMVMSTRRLDEAQCISLMSILSPSNFLYIFFLQVDNSRLTMSCFEPIVLIYDHHENKWKSRDVNQ